MSRTCVVCLVVFLVRSLSHVPRAVISGGQERGDLASLAFLVSMSARLD
jgi:hypothetical protein